MTAIRVPLGSLYVDNLRYEDPTDSPVIINMVPTDAETGVYRARSINLTVASLTGMALDATVKVYWTSTILGVASSEVLVYDQAAGGFQAGYSGTATPAQSPDAGVNDELWLAITRATEFESEERIDARVVASTGGGASTTESTYYFVAEDVTPPVITEALWLTPTRCRLKWDEKLQDDGEPGSGHFHVALDESIEIEAPGYVRLSATYPVSDWIGYYCHLTGSAYVQNNGARKIIAVSTALRRLTLDTSQSDLVSDDGIDTDDTGSVTRQRTLKAHISPYRFEYRTAGESAGSPPNPEDLIHVAYEPGILSARQPHTDELALSDDPDYYVVLDLLDGISFGRPYTIRALDVIDQDGNTTGGAGETFDFTSPLFGLSAARMTVWGLLDPYSRSQDAENGLQLRRMAMVIQDLLDQFSYWTLQVEYLRDPATCPESLLDHFLYMLGHPFRFRIVTERQKRLLCSMLLGAYTRAGTEYGIEQLLQIYLRTPFDVIPHLTNEACWILGQSYLGYDTWLGPSGARLNNTYDVVKQDENFVLTDDDRQAVREICEWADPVYMHFGRLIEDLDSYTNPMFWILGQSRLGVSTVLR